MGGEGLTRRTVLRTAALATTVFTTPFVRSAATATVVPKGKLVLAWHTNIAARWLDPQQHDGTASPDNFIMALHDFWAKPEIGVLKTDIVFDHAGIGSHCVKLAP